MFSIRLPYISIANSLCAFCALLWLTLASWPLPDGDRLNHITANDLVDHVHSRYHSSKNCIATVEMWLRRMSHEPLGAAGVLARERHSDCCTVVEQLIDFTADLVSGSAVTVAPWIAVLNHKIGHYPVNRDVSKVVSLGKLNEVVYGKGGCFGEQVNSKRTLAGSHDGSHAFADSAESAFVICIRIARLHRSNLRREIAGAVRFQNIRGPATDERIAGFQRFFDDLVCGWGLLFTERIEDRECSVVQRIVGGLWPGGCEGASVFFCRRKIAEQIGCGATNDDIACR